MPHIECAQIIRLIQVLLALCTLDIFSDNLDRNSFIIYHIFRDAYDRNI